MVVAAIVPVCVVNARQRCTFFALGCRMFDFNISRYQAIGVVLRADVGWVARAPREAVFVARAGVRSHMAERVLTPQIINNKSDKNQDGDPQLQMDHI